MEDLLQAEGYTLEEARQYMYFQILGKYDNVKEIAETIERQGVLKVQTTS